jgi:hypothetical protein
MDRPRESDALRNSIVRSIQREEVRRARVSTLLALTAVGASVLGIAFSIQYAVHSLVQSGFLEYMSLIFSDADILAAYWQGFAFSLLETIPLFAITLGLAALAAFLASLRVLATNMRGGLTFSSA